jgi:hypothetical protein
VSAINPGAFVSVEKKEILRVPKVARASKSHVERKNAIFARPHARFFLEFRFSPTSRSGALRWSVCANSK